MHTLHTSYIVKHLYTKRAKIFQHLNLLHTNNTKSDYFMKGNKFKFEEILKSDFRFEIYTFELVIVEHN